MIPLNAVLLAAGYGTRLYPLTRDCPKALLPLGEAVLLDPMMDNLLAVPGLAKTVLVTNHRFAEGFRQWAAQRRRTLEIIDNGTATPQTRLGAVRDLLLALARVPSDEDVVVLGTDNLFTWSLAEFVEFAMAKRPAAVIALRPAASAEEATRCGVAELAADPSTRAGGPSLGMSPRGLHGRVIRFVEKPAVPPSMTVVLCVYYFPAPLRNRIRQFIQEGGNGDAPGYLIEWLVSREPVHGFMTGGAWFDIGTLETYQLAVQRWQRMRSSGSSQVRTRRRNA